MSIDRREVFVICLRDMSERLAAEQALRDSETRYRTLVETAPEVIVVIDTQSGACTDANENALQILRRERANGLRRSNCATCCGRGGRADGEAARRAAHAARIRMAAIGAATAPRWRPRCG